MAPGKRTKGTRQLAVAMTEALFDEFKAFCEGRGETARYHLELALRRHMDAPPAPPAPVVIPPLAPVATTALAKGSRGKKPNK